MNNDNVQHVKMAWLAAEEAGDRERQLELLRDHPDAQESLIDFIAAYRITESREENAQQIEILPLTQRAFATTLERVFSPSVARGGLRQLREKTGQRLVETARGLKLGLYVWKKFL